MKTKMICRPYVLPFAVAIAVIASLFTPSQANAQVKNWINPGVGQNWTNAGNWSPFGAPGFADLARIGNLPIAEGSNVALTNNQTIGGLEITNGASLFINAGGRLGVNSNTVVSGANGSPSRLLIHAVGGLALTTDNLTITGGAEFRINNGAEVIVNQNMIVNLNSELNGRGVIEFLKNTGNVFVNNGEINTTAGIGGLVLNQGGDGLIDLDGVSGNGSVAINNGNGFFGQDRFTINGTQLADSFSGTIDMTTASILQMNLSDGWTADANSQINIQSTTTNSDGSARIQGGHVTFAGTMHYLSKPGGSADGSDDFALINAPTTVQDTAEFNIEQDNQLLFQGATILNGGTFNTHSTNILDGAAKFNGLTTYDGTVTINGLARQQGDAIVSGATTINADRIDMHGIGNVVWDINHSLTVNAGRIQTTSQNLFNGTINIGSGFVPKLAINLDDPNDQWTMAGEMNLANLNFVPFSISRVAGSPMRLTGELNVIHLVGISSSTTFDNGSVTNIETPTTRLSLHGQTTIRPSAIFNGQGFLVNTSDEGLRLEDGVSLDEVGLINAGLLEVGNSPGVAAVDRFENTADGTWLVEIGGHVAGAEHDLLLVTDGMTQLDGMIEVNLIDAGGGLFLPEVGDEFTVLTSLSAVSGMFLNDPISMAAGQAFHWEVLYHPNDVTLVLNEINNIVPEPGACALLASAALCLIIRTRKNK